MSEPVKIAKNQKQIAFEIISAFKLSSKSSRESKAIGNRQSK
jgi:hypothetical protein